MEKIEVIKDYMKHNRIDIDRVIEDYYGYVYIIVKNTKGIGISDEDMEEIISDVFLALWKNSPKLDKNIAVKAYLAGISKNMIKNKYRTTRMDEPISDYEEKVVNSIDLEALIEEREQNKIMKESLRQMKEEEYKTFIMFYYEAKKIKDIAEELKISESKVKVILHRVRKKMKGRLKEGGYGYGL